MQQAVLSLWTGTTGFYLDRAAAMLFSASVAYAGAAFKHTEFVTDIRGLEISDRLGWDFTSHVAALEGFRPKGAEHVWMLGKIKAQEIQTEPFAHVDLDMLMFQPLPSRLTSAPVIVQSKDHPASYHDPFVSGISKHCGIPHDVAPFNTGLVGWNDLGFMREYCAESLRLSIHAGQKYNKPEWGGCISIICEQLLLAHLAREKKLRVETAVPMPHHIQPQDMSDVKFAHFWGNSKRDPKWLAAVEKKFAVDHPVEYKKFLHGWAAMQGVKKPGYGYAPKGFTSPIHPDAL